MDGPAGSARSGAVLGSDTTGLGGGGRGRVPGAAVRVGDMRPPVARRRRAEGGGGDGPAAGRHGGYAIPEGGAARYGR
jgi:hypothetical protein